MDGFFTHKAPSRRPLALHTHWKVVPPGQEPRHLSHSWDTGPNTPVLVSEGMGTQQGCLGIWFTVRNVDQTSTETPSLDRSVSSTSPPSNSAVGLSQRCLNCHMAQYVVSAHQMCAASEAMGAEEGGEAAE
jgi:hypothetical protein